MQTSLFAAADAHLYFVSLLQGRSICLISCTQDTSSPLSPGFHPAGKVIVDSIYASSPHGGRRSTELAPSEVSASQPEELGVGEARAAGQDAGDGQGEVGRGAFSEGTSGFGALTAAVFREQPRVSFSHFGKREVWTQTGDFRFDSPRARHKWCTSALSLPGSSKGR